MARVHDDANASLGPSINHVVLVGGGRGRVRPIFFDQVGHETMYAFSGNQHFLLNNVIVRPTKNMNRDNKNWAHLKIKVFKKLH